MPCTQRPLKEMCHQLTVVAVAQSGALRDRPDRFGYAKLVSPRSRGIRVRNLLESESVHVQARLSGPPGNQVGTLVITGEFPGHVWIDETPVRIARGGFWMLRCQGCNRPCRSVFWPPRGSVWRCRKCLRLRYPDGRRINTLLPLPDAEDELDFLERDLRRLRLLRKFRRKYDTVRRAPQWVVTL
jgi:hypothetical protein